MACVSNTTLQTLKAIGVDIATAKADAARHMDEQANMEGKVRPEWRCGAKSTLVSSSARILSDNGAARVYACPNPDACIVRDDDTADCADGYRGPLCGLCQEGHVWSEGHICKPCTGDTLAWRVGASLADVVAHDPKAFDGPPSIHETEGFEGHAWVEVAGLIVDSTANQWEHKLQRLGLVNGLKPTLEWPQDVLVIEQGRLKKSLESVLRARTFAAHYQALDGFKPALDQCDLSAEDVAEVKAEFESTAQREDAPSQMA
jgi:hypothetical protein